MDGIQKNITVSLRADEIMETLVQEGLFNNHQEAYRSAISVALAQNLPLDSDFKMTKNKWDTAAVFYSSDSNVESLLLLKGIDKNKIVEAGKILAENGLRFLEHKRQSNSDLMKFLIAK